MVKHFAREFWGWAVDMAHSAVLPALQSFLIAVPIFAVLATVWGYLSIERGSRSLKAALLKVLPIEDYRSASIRTDVYNFIFVNCVLNPALGIFLKIAAVVISSQLLAGYLTETFGSMRFRVTSGIGITAIQVVATILSYELGFYVWHRMSHTVEVLWSFHRSHHSAESLTVFTSPREHPANLVLNAVVSLLISSVLIGTALYFTTAEMSSAALRFLGAYAAFGSLLTLLHHSRVRVSLGVLDRVLNTPVLHQLHHSAEARHRDRNFGSMLSIWDFVFGTLYVPKRDETWRIGLNEQELGSANPHKRVRDFYLEPFRHAAAVLKKNHRKTAE